MGTVLLLFSLVLAPVPQATPKKAPSTAAQKAPPAFIGSWQMRWSTGQGEAAFAPDGGYWCLWGGQQWVGHWQLVGGRLTVTESRLVTEPGARPEGPIRWEVQLDATGRGGEVVHDGRRFAFRLTQKVLRVH